MYYIINVFEIYYGYIVSRIYNVRSMTQKCDIGFCDVGFVIKGLKGQA